MRYKRRLNDGPVFQDEDRCGGIECHGPGGLNVRGACTLSAAERYSIRNWASLDRGSMTSTVRQADETAYSFVGGTVGGRDAPLQQVIVVKRRRRANM